MTDPAITLPIFPRLQGKTVLITGASAGIGAATARAFAASGSNVILTARRLERVEALVAQIRQSYPKVKAFPALLDVKSSASHDALKASLPSELKDIDVLVLNAGIVHLGQVDETSESLVDDILDTNVKGLLNGIRAFVPAMKARNSGHILLVSSILGKQSNPGISVYSASKFAVEAISDGLRKELQMTALKVTKISPGYTETDIITASLGGDNTSLTLAKSAGLDEILQASDIAEDIVFAASRHPREQIQDIITAPTSQA